MQAEGFFIHRGCGVIVRNYTFYLRLMNRICKKVAVLRHSALAGARTRPRSGPNLNAPRGPSTRGARMEWSRLFRKAAARSAHIDTHMERFKDKALTQRETAFLSEGGLCMGVWADYLTPSFTECPSMETM